MRTLTQIVDDYYRSSPDWPLPVPTDFAAEARDFLADDRDEPWSTAEVESEIRRFWSAPA